MEVAREQQDQDFSAMEDNDMPMIIKVDSDHQHDDQEVPAMVDMPMTIEVHRDQHDQNFCTVKIDNCISPVEIKTTLAVSKNHINNNYVIDGSKIKEWVRNIKNSPERIIGISFKNENDDNRCYGCSYAMVQFCIGNQCLIYVPGWFDPKREVPKAMKDILSNGKYTVVGVGMEEIAKNLEKYLAVKISRSRDLGEMAGLGHNVQEKNSNNKRKKMLSVEKLAKRVLNENWTKWTNRNGINWWRGDDDDESTTLSDDLVKYGTLDAFLAYKMGKKLIESTN